MEPGADIAMQPSDVRGARRSARVIRAGLRVALWPQEVALRFRGQTAPAGPS